jgi:hypothetical protein
VEPVEVAGGSLELPDWLLTTGNRRLHNASLLGAGMSPNSSMMALQCINGVRSNPIEGEHKFDSSKINVREYRRAIKMDNPEKLAIQGTQDEGKNKAKTQRICWTPLYANKHKR